MDKICIGIPAYGNHPPDMGLRLAVITTNLHKENIALDRIISPSSMAADANRNSIVKAFLETKSEWLFWVDTDNMIPHGSIRRLLNAEQTIVSGIYHLKAAPYTPIAYWRQPDGRYRPISNFRKGELIEVDMIGMGCVLTHRTVFESIIRNYVPFQRRFGGTVMIHKDDIIDGEGTNPDNEKAGKLQGDIFYDILEPIPQDRTDQAFPIFRIEYNRTEDVGFCEMAKRCGHAIFVDTGVESGHAVTRMIGAKDYRNTIKEATTKHERTSDWIPIVRKVVMFDENS